MPRVFEKTRFYWLSFALVGIIITLALARELPDSLALILIEYSSIVLLLISLISAPGWTPGWPGRGRSRR